MPTVGQKRHDVQIKDVTIRGELRNEEAYGSVRLSGESTRLKIFRDGTEKLMRCFIIFPASAALPLELIKLSILKFPLAADGIYSSV